MDVGMTAMKGLTARRSGRSFCAGLEGVSRQPLPSPYANFRCCDNNLNTFQNRAYGSLISLSRGRRAAFVCSRVRGGRESGFP